MFENLNLKGGFFCPSYVSEWRCLKLLVIEGSYLEQKLDHIDNILELNVK